MPHVSIAGLSAWFRFFFFKQKTAYEMRISDWSSDVCSSDLGLEEEGLMQGHQAVVQLIDSVEVAPLPGGMQLGAEPRRHVRGDGDAAMPALRQKWHHSGEIGRASCRERVCPYV